MNKQTTTKDLEASILYTTKNAFQVGQSLSGKCHCIVTKTVNQVTEPEECHTRPIKLYLLSLHNETSMSANLTSMTLL